MLPIEFARISQDSRLTLVIHPGSTDQPTYWALSDLTTVNEACRNLRRREGSNSVDMHHVLRDGTAVGTSPDIAQRVVAWLAFHEDLAAAVWTGLPSNWKEKRGRDFTAEDAVAFLLELESEHDRAKAAYDRAREYVRNTPAIVDTVVRKAMRARGWEDARLSSILFEPAPTAPKSTAPTPHKGD